MNRHFLRIVHYHHFTIIANQRLETTEKITHILESIVSSHGFLVFDIQEHVERLQRLFALRFNFNNSITQISTNLIYGYRADLLNLVVLNKNHTLAAQFYSFRLNLTLGLQRIINILYKLLMLCRNIYLADIEFSDICNTEQEGELLIVVLSV